MTTEIKKPAQSVKKKSESIPKKQDKESVPKDSNTAPYFMTSVPKRDTVPIPKYGSDSDMKNGNNTKPAPKATKSPADKIIPPAAGSPKDSAAPDHKSPEKTEPETNN